MHNRQNTKACEQKPSHILTVSVEEYFHAGAFQRILQSKHWDRLEQRLDESLGQVLSLLNRYNQTATFFFLGCVAAKRPELVSRILADGHEIAASTFWPKSLDQMLPEEFEDDLTRTREVLTEAGVDKVSGFRTSRSWMKKRNLWALDILADHGYVYDSSLNPISLRFIGLPERYQVHTHHSPSGNTICEFPIATYGVCGLRFGISGGNWIRQLPHTLLHRIVNYQQRRCDRPMVFYFMPWELDKWQPKLSGLSRLTRIRHYRNLGKTSWVFDHYLRVYNFTSIGDYLGLAEQRYSVSPESNDRSQEKIEIPKEVREKVSLVIPLFNEENNIIYLRRTLDDLKNRLKDGYEFFIVLVDDGSNDKTWQEVNTYFSDMTRCRLVQQPRNMGVAAAILRGVKEAPTEVVCSIDCDCSYDPYVLRSMLPLIKKADLVTASPYHPEGNVLNVPSWRLLLSKTLSRMYSMVLGKRLYTFTSCCRVYRKSVLAGVEINDPGFLGVAEMLIRMMQNGARIVEHPATLESRVLGESKMKTLNTIKAHLQFLRELVT